jgi:hypothetical protein
LSRGSWCCLAAPSGSPAPPGQSLRGCSCLKCRERCVKTRENHF